MPIPRRLQRCEPLGLAIIVCLLATSLAGAATQFTETWESYTNGATPYGDWQLGSGTGFTWGGISSPGRENGKCYTIAANQKSRIVRPIVLDSHNHIALQGWLYDSGGANRSVLGLARLVGSNDNSLIRIGAGSAANYTIQYFDSYQSTSVITVDTGLPAQAGWHFLRLDIMYDGNPSNLWTVTWRIWNAAQTAEKMGVFGWYFDRANCDYVTLGAAAATPAAMAWDDIKVGSLADVGPAPSLPLGPWQINQTVMASSEISGWEAAKACDGNSGTVWSSVGHGAEANAVEWLVVDYGQVFLMTGVSIYPRPGGACFPVDYRIQYTTDGVIWTTVPGMSFAGQPTPTGEVSLTFGSAISARGLRLYATKLSPDGANNHYLQIAEFKPLGTEPWAYPSELRGKKVINAAQYSTLNLYNEDAPLPAFLADHPDYLANHPFDGLSVPILLDRQWLTSQGLLEAEYALQDLVMTKLPIPWSQVSSAVADLNRINWGHVTDNFLWYRVSDASTGDFDTRYAVDPASSSDWAVVTQNAALCARICREAGLKGFMMDTEMYTNYAGGELYPFGLGTPATWRERGQQWIEAIQSEFPGITIIFFFSWGPETEGAWPGYENLKYFMNGVLAGVQAPARLIHGWESTFWWGGQRYMGGDPNDPNSYNHYPGDRTAYAGARNDIKNVWRNLSDNPTKYDQFVEAGMAAFVDSDPYNLWPGWPSGYLTDWPWSNLPYTLAYSDSYVWVWAAHTHYSATRDVLNPFMASIANQTFNTGREAVTYLIEDFDADPLARGWYFDFDMLDIGRHPSEEHGFPFLPVMTTDSVAYKWDPTDQAVRVEGSWTTGSRGETVAAMCWQRRRYVHPLRVLGRADDFRATFDFQVEAFGSDPANPIVLGLFNSGGLLDRQSITLRIAGPSAATITVAGDGTPWVSPLSLSHSLNTATTYRIRFVHNGQAGSFQATLTDMSDLSIVAQVAGTVPGSVGSFQLDEVGAALWDVDVTSTPPAQAYQYLLKKATVTPFIGVVGDFDGDGDVDQSDFGLLQCCLAGSQAAIPSGCEPYDLDRSQHVDQGDLVLFEFCAGGPALPPACQ